MNERFPVLSTVSTIMKFTGWLIVVLGLVFAIYEGMIEPSKPGHHFFPNDAVQIGLGILTGVVGLSVVAMSEIIGVLFAIEVNSRNTADRILFLKSSLSK